MSHPSAVFIYVSNQGSCVATLACDSPWSSGYILFIFTVISRIAAVVEEAVSSILATSNGILQLSGPSGIGRSLMIIFLQEMDSKESLLSMAPGLMMG